MLTARERKTVAARPSHTIALVGLFTLAVFYTLFIARALFLPIAVALLLDFLLSPAVRWLRRQRIPNAVSAAALLLGILLAFGIAAATLAGPAATWIQRAPATVNQIKQKARTLARPFEQVQRSADRVTEAAEQSASTRPAEVHLAGPSLQSRMFGLTADVLSTGAIIFFLTFFLLAADDLFLRKIIEIFPQSRTKGPAANIAREIESGISRYMVTVTAINIGLGLATWGLFAALGMPNAGLWGAVAGLTNFIPYVGALAANLVFAAAAIVSFDSLGRALLLPASFFLLNMLESYVVTPAVMGRQFPLNPVAILIGIMVWGFIWGVPGAILAVPIMVMMKTICDHIEALEPAGAFLGN